MKAIALWLTALGLGLTGCASPPSESPIAPERSAPPPAATVVQAPPAPPPAAPPPPPPPTLPHAEAVLTAANALFSKANLDGLEMAPNKRYAVVVDPLIDGVSRMQTKATQAMEQRIVKLVKASYPQFDIKPLSAAALDAKPLLVVGTFTPINQQGKTEGLREMYRFCLAMVDLKSGKLVSKTVARSRMEQVDATPLPFFADSPAYAADPPAEGYVKTCQASKAGDPIHADYVASLVASSPIEEGIRHYNGGKFKLAEAAFKRAQATPVGQQLRVLNGLYLSQVRQGKRAEGSKHLASLVDYSMQRGRLGLMFRFDRGATTLPLESSAAKTGAAPATDMVAALDVPASPAMPGRTRGFRPVAPAEEAAKSAEVASLTALAPDPRGDAARSAIYRQWLQVLGERLVADKRCAEIVGHTSRGGSEEINERLSALRAEHVRRRLVATQPELDRRLIATGVGSRENLVGTGKDDASDQLDRRVDVKLLTCSS